MIEEKKKHFIENIYNPFLDEKIIELENYFFENRRKIRLVIVKKIKEIFSKCIDIIDFDVAYMVCTILRTNILEGDYICPIMVYDSGFYMSKGCKVGEIDFTSIYKFYEECHDNGLKNFRRYSRALNEADIKAISMGNLGKFNDFVEKVIRYSIYEITELEEYQKISKDEKFYMIAGEYFEFTTVVYNENKNKNYFELKEQLESTEAENLALVAEDFRELELEKMILSSKTFLYCDFNYSKISQIVYSFNILIGTRFTNSNLEKVVFHKCNLSEADFRNSKIQDCIFTECLMILEHEAVRYVEANLSNCFFENTKLINCLIEGADFRNSNLENLEIISTVFQNCVFSKTHKELLFKIDDNIIKNNFFE